MELYFRDDRRFSLHFANNQVVKVEDQDDLNVMVRNLLDEYDATGQRINTENPEYTRRV